MSLDIAGVDYAWGNPDYDALKSSGAKFAMRYLSGGGSKDLTAGEKDKLYAKGIAVGLVWETSGGRATAGRGAGEVDALAAKVQANRLGLDGIPIYFAVDFDASIIRRKAGVVVESKADLHEHADSEALYQIHHELVMASIGSISGYFAGVVSVLGSRSGVYGSVSVVESLKGSVNWLWQTYAWSGGRVSGSAHVLQWKNGVTIGGLDCDLDKASAKGMESMRGPGAGQDVLDYLTKTEQWDVRRLEKYRANARERGQRQKPPVSALWIDSERKTAESIKERLGRVINKIEAGYKGMSAAKKKAYLDRANRRERMAILRDVRANRELEV